MNNRFFSLRIFLAALAFATGGLSQSPAQNPASAGSAADQAALARVTGQFCDYYFNVADPATTRGYNDPGPNIAKAGDYARSQTPFGSWPDVKYDGMARSDWEPGVHLTRLLAMELASGRVNVSPAERETLETAVHRGLSFWIAHDFQSPNWWSNEIGTPKSIGMVALLLGDRLTPQEYAYATGASLARFPIARTGQNRVWLAANVLMRGLLLKDPKMVSTASATIWDEVKITPDDGLQIDSSFHQHGPQEQFGNYGLSFAVEESHAALILRDSPWSMPPEKAELLRNFLLLGVNWIVWRGAYDLSACDRQLMPGAPAKKYRIALGVMETATAADPAHAPQYRAFIDRNQSNSDTRLNDLVGDRYFWRSDYYIHRTPNAMITLKLSSNRVIGEETVNSENLSGYHGADGVLLLHASGREYEEIPALWDWSRLPGVTCTVAPPPRFLTSRVPTDFVGGIAGDNGGLAALDYDRDGVKAHKAWFFGEKGVVCLGAGISGPEGISTQTAINQSRLHGLVVVQTAHEAGQRVGDNALHQASAGYYEQDGWRYTLFGGTKPVAHDLDVTGNWKKVFQNPDTPEAPVKAHVFLLGIDHGMGAKNGAYAYAASAAGVDPEAEVLRNEPALQAVSLGGKEIGIVFWTAGQFVIPDGRLIRTSAPCLMWIDGEKILVCDPTQKLPEISVAVNGREKNLGLPRGENAGSPILN